MTLNGIEYRVKMHQCGHFYPRPVHDIQFFEALDPNVWMSNPCYRCYREESESVWYSDDKAVKGWM